MKRMLRVLLCAVFVHAGVCRAVSAQTGAPAQSPAPAAGPSYDDPGMHFSAPEGWERLELVARSSDGQPGPVAVFIKNRGKYDQKTILITIGSFSGTLDGLESVHESETRSQQEGTFVDKKLRVTLPNGMPAWWLKVTTGTDVGKFSRRYEYVVFDGKRRIVVAYAGRLGDVEEKEAQAALASLVVVLFPRGR